MFVDEAKIQVIGGKGGDGVAVMHREKYIAFGGPSGGRGGRGACVYLMATTNKKTLQSFRGHTHYRGDTGGKGGRQDKTGRGAKDLIVEVPMGTLVRDAETGDLLADLAEEGERYLAAQGGRGGRGNKALVCEAEPLPKWCEKGTPGAERWITLELKVMADVGLVGLPNAGKSTLLAALSNARPKIAAYPFTTLEPNLGHIPVGEAWSDRAFVMADIPGLVEGAHEGTGLGDRFLRHVERTRLLLHLVDVSGFEGHDPVASYRTIRAELEAHHPELAERPEIVVGTKLDVPEAAEGMAALSAEVGENIRGISAATRKGLEELVNFLADTLDKMPEQRPRRFEPVREVFTLEAEDVKFEIVREDHDFWHVMGADIERLIGVLDLEDPEALPAMDHRLRVLGVYAKLASLGAEEDHTVRVGDFLFDYIPEV